MIRPLLLLPLLGACAHAPVGWVVPGAALEELSRDTRAPFDRAAFDAAVRAGFGADAAPAAWLEDQWRRLDVGAADAAPAPWLEDGGRGPDADAWLDGLRSGDLVLVKNVTPRSLASTVGLAEPTWFDHAGVLVLDDAGPAVIESWPQVRLLILTPSFAARFRGRAQRTPLADFLARYHHAWVLRPPGEGAGRVAAALDLVEAGVAFDPYYDPLRPELSCSEFVQACLDPGLASALVPIPVSPQPSITRAREALGFAVPAFVQPDTFARLPRVRVVAELGRHLARGEVAALRALWWELHARSQEPGAGFGDWLRVDRWRLFGWHPRTVALLEWTVGLARRDPAGDPVLRARALVDLVLAPPAAGPAR